MSFNKFNVAISTVMMGGLLALPLTQAFADTVPTAKPTSLAATHGKDKAEDLDARITKLHAELKITSDEEILWTPVAQAMRDNVATMEKLVADKHMAAASSLSALDDLKTYQEFAQAHVDGLKNLTTAFEALYIAMPDGQKKTADHVFATFGHAMKTRGS